LAWISGPSRLGLVRVQVCSSSSSSSSPPSEPLPFGDKEYEPWKRKEFIRRYGYKPKYFTEGLLPRVKGDTKPLRSVPYKDPPTEWSRDKALFGQNDYIDILGDGSLHPVQLLRKVPSWLRGFRGNEMQMLQRKRMAYIHWKKTSPERFNHIEKRIDYLYKYLNYRHRPPKHAKY
jgi:large subunit ribosomal protein L51